MFQIEIVGIKGKDVKVRIARQDYRNDAFYCDGEKLYGFFFWKGFCLISRSHPLFYYDSNTQVFFCRGIYTEFDDRIVSVPLKMFKMLKETIDEYNRKDVRNGRTKS